MTVSTHHYAVPELPYVIPAYSRYMYRNFDTSSQEDLGSSFGSAVLGEVDVAELALAESGVPPLFLFTSRLWKKFCSTSCVCGAPRSPVGLVAEVGDVGPPGRPVPAGRT